LLQQLPEASQVDVLDPATLREKKQSIDIKRADGYFSLMIAHDRHRLILSLLVKEKRLTVVSLQAATKVSPATLRRDLDFLASRDLLVRVHGAVLHPSAARGEPSLLQKLGLAVRAKQKIGSFAAGLAKDAGTVFLDSGTTCLEVARHLRSRADLTIITNSLPVIASHEHFKARLVVVGGERRAVSGALVGDLAREAIDNLRADVAFVGASGLDPLDGPGTTEISEKTIKAAWLERSRRRVLVCDATKWQVAAAFVFAPWKNFTDFVCDLALPQNSPPNPPTMHIV
jgi:DeoR/GlpR family transcriptional regulator of sugar metabolism